MISLVKKRPSKIVLVGLFTFDIICEIL